MCAIVTKVGRGANLPADAIFPLSLFDDAHRPLDASNKYTIQFDKGTMPPVGADAFWSIALHDKDGFKVANNSQRFVVSSWMPFNDNGSGSLDRYFQNESQGADLEPNWLPAPKGPLQCDNAAVCAQNGSGRHRFAPGGNPNLPGVPCLKRR